MVYRASVRGEKMGGGVNTQNHPTQTTQMCTGLPRRDSWKNLGINSRMLQILRIFEINQQQAEKLVGKDINNQNQEHSGMNHVVYE